MKRQATEWEEIFANIYPTQNFYLECVKNSYNSVIRRQFNLKIGGRFEWILPQRRYVDGTEAHRKIRTTFSHEENAKYTRNETPQHNHSSS